LPTISAAVAPPCTDAHAQQVVPTLGDQLGVQASRQRPGERVAGGELLGGPGAVEGDLAEVANPGESCLPTKSNSAKFASVLRIGGMLTIGRSVSLSSTPSST
jgi:hypothetical protein